MMFKGLREFRHVPDPASDLALSEEARFLPVEIVAETLHTPAAPAAAHRIEIGLGGGHRTHVGGSCNPEVPAWPIRGLAQRDPGSDEHAGLAGFRHAARARILM